MASQVEFQIKSYISTAAIGAYELVKKSGTEVVVAGVGDQAIGVTMANAAAGTTVPVRLFNGYGTAFMKAGAAITAGAKVRGIASGKIDDTATGPIVGFAEEAATADGDVIEVLLVGASPAAYLVGAGQAAVAVTGATNSSPYGFTTAAQADAIVTLVNQLRADLILAGIIKGAA